MGSLVPGRLISETDLRAEGVFFPESHVPATSPAQQSVLANVRDIPYHGIRNMS